MKLTPILSLTLGLVCLFGVAHAADAGAPKTAGAPGAAAPAKKIDWEHASVADKKKYMKTTVLPTMKPLFQAYDGKAYKKFSCGTCHGEGAVDGKFKMPNAKLPKLPTSQAGFMALNAKKPEAVKFMGQVVKPKMAELLGMPEWQPTAPTGFGCYQCHMKEEGK